jgi:hypothetical protein
MLLQGMMLTTAQLQCLNLLRHLIEQGMCRL